MKRRGIEPPKIERPDAFRLFQEKYYHEPAKFVRHCIYHDKGVTEYQNEILEQLPVVKRVLVRAPHGAGKTALAAWVVLWAILTEDDCKVPTTASGWRQLTHFLWPEVHKWSARLIWSEVGRKPFTRDELLSRSIRRGPTCEAFAVASDNAETIEGAHAKRIVYVYDEAKAIQDETFDASEGAFSQAGVGGREAFALAISTPGEPQGRFFDISSRKPGYEDWWTRHITMNEAVAEGMMSEDWVGQRRRQWGENSAIFKNRVLGDFAAGSVDGVIPLPWVELAQERWRDWVDAGKPGEFTGVGVDVAGGKGGDTSVIAPCYADCKIDVLRVYSHDNPNLATMQLAGRVKGILDGRGGICVIDAIGVGAGPYHRLREQFPEARIKPFVASEKTDHRDKAGEMGFADKRSAGWWILREMLDPTSDWEVCLPPDDPERGLEITGDLTAPTYKEMSGGKIRVEPKVDIKKRIKRSTNCGDAIMHILAKQLVQATNPFLGFL